MKLTRPFAMVEKDVLFSPELTALEKLVYCVLCAFSDNNTRSCYPSYNTIAEKVGCSKKTAIQCVASLCDGCRKWNNEQRKADIAAIYISLFCHRKNNTSTLPMQNQSPLLHRKNQILRLMANHIGVIQNGWKMLKIELNMITLRNICRISFIWWISFASVSLNFMILLSLKTENC